VSAGNAVVFNVHPAAKQVSAHNIRLLNRAIVAAGGPPDLVTAVAEPTIETAKELMHHPDVRVLLVTGGPGVVKEALKTDKRAVTAGPGNPPVVVDETADIEQAARDIVRGASFDNNVICTDEKTTIAVAGSPTGWSGDGPPRRLRAQGARAAPPRAGDLPEPGPPNKPGGSTRGGSARTPHDPGRDRVRADDDVRLLVAGCPTSTTWSGPSR
jgi:hypothetical protein